MQSLLSLYLLSTCIVCTFGLSFGLTHISNHHCYAGVCGEWLFPNQARRHVAVWYSWLAITLGLLSVRALRPGVRKVTSMHLRLWVPLMDKRLTVGGLVWVMWQSVLYGILVGIWWPRLDEYFQDRGKTGDGKSLAGNGLLASVALSGHLADVTMGLVLLPVTRNGALAAFFKLESSTNYIFHMTQAYLLLAMAAAHGFTYVSWVALYNGARDLYRQIYPILNPTYYYHEVWPGNTSSLGIWRASLVFSGIVATSIMLLMMLTSFPVVRERHFNMFYFTHLLAILAVIIICLHASTMLYCLAPGLCMWVLDWGLRTLELRQRVDGDLTALGKGWYSLTVCLPRQRLVARCNGKSPLAHFHIQHTASSRFEVHPFTTTTHLDSAEIWTKCGKEYALVNFLFREIPSRESRLGTQFRGSSRVSWTSKLAALTDEENIVGTAYTSYSGSTLDSLPPIRTPFYKSENSTASCNLSAPPGAEDSEAVSSSSSSTIAPSTQDRSDSRRTSTSMSSNESFQEQLDKPARAQADQQAATHLRLRLEGPYFSAAKPTSFRTVVCLVAGTGVTGAIAIAQAFRAQKVVAKETGGSSDHLEPTHWIRCIIVWVVRDSDYVELPGVEGMSVKGLEVRVHRTGGGKERPDMTMVLDELCRQDGAGSWCYICGPPGFVSSAERACARIRGLTWHGST